MVADDGWIGVTQPKSVIMSPSHLYDSREFKKRGSGECETRPELTFRISDERSMLAAFSNRLDNST